MQNTNELRSGPCNSPEIIVIDQFNYKTIVKAPVE